MGRLALVGWNARRKQSNLLFTVFKNPSTCESYLGIPSSNELTAYKLRSGKVKAELPKLDGGVPHP